MESYEIRIINLNTHEESVLLVEVDEAEPTDCIVIKASILGQNISASDYNYLRLHIRRLEINYMN